MKAKPVTSSFDIVSWNIDFASSQASPRCRSIIDRVLEHGVPDVLCLQEVRSDVQNTILSNPIIREAFLTTNAEVDLENQRYTTMTLLSRRRFAYALDPEEKVESSEKFTIGPVFREQLPTRSGRDGLCVDLIPPYAPDTFLRFMNVHLESCDAFDYRARQLGQVARLLHDSSCSGGLIVGDFNAISDEDDELVGANGLEDAWLTLHGDTNADAAPTWNVGRTQDSIHAPRRLDKLVTVGVTATTMHVMHPGLIQAPKPGGAFDLIPWSDHSGLRCTISCHPLSV
ncbi:hypothetical protein MMC07_007729 [Pseudocyphellaria aurata]|nr:hypothetical protein [Pseudocyphellaria aurata]